MSVVTQSQKVLVGRVDERRRGHAQIVAPLALQLPVAGTAPLLCQAKCEGSGVRPLENSSEALINCREGLKNSSEALINCREGLKNSFGALKNGDRALMNSDEAIS